MEHLGLTDNDLPVVTDSGTADADDFSGVSGDFGTLGLPVESDGDSIDTSALTVQPEDASAEKPAARARRTSSKVKSDDAPRAAKAGPPTLDEWTSFFSRVVLRVVTDFYISMAFRGVDENALTDREIERLALSDDERNTIAVPFAELSNKSSFMRKHGRMIVASGDAFNAIVVLGAWVSRVNRIAARHKPRNANSRVRKINNGSSGSGPSEANGSQQYPEGANGGRIYGDFPIFPGTG